MRRLPVILAAAALAATLAGGCAKNDTVTAEQKVASACPEASGDSTCKGATCADKPCGGTCAEKAGGLTKAEVGLEVGMTPPAFTLKDIGGADVSLSDFEGKVVILDLWATWCGPCRQEIPMLVSLYEEFKDRGLVVVGVGLDQGGAKVIKPFAESNRMSYPVLVGDQAIAKTYKVTGIPSTFVIGPDGAIVSKHVGFQPSVAQALRADVERLTSQAGREA